MKMLYQLNLEIMTVVVSRAAGGSTCKMVEAGGARGALTLDKKSGWK